MQNKELLEQQRLLAAQTIEQCLIGSGRQEPRFRLLSAPGVGAVISFTLHTESKVYRMEIEKGSIPGLFYVTLMDDLSQQIDRYSVERNNDALYYVVGSIFQMAYEELHKPMETWSEIAQSYQAVPLDDKSVSDG